MLRAPVAGAPPVGEPAPPPQPHPAPVPAQPPQMDFGFQSDPGLQETMLTATAGRDRSLARIKDARRNALVNFGSSDIARSVLGAEDPTLGAISSDPDKSNSVLAQIGRGYRDTVAQTEDALNKDNLFYSGHRAKTLAGLASDRLRQESDAEAQLRQQLTGFSDASGQAEEEYRGAVGGAQRDAYQRFLDQALQYGIGPAPAPEEGAPGDTPPQAPPAPVAGERRAVRPHARRRQHSLAPAVHRRARALVQRPRAAGRQP